MLLSALMMMAHKVNKRLFSNGPSWCGSVDWVLACEPKATGSIPGQGTCLGCGPGPRLGACERQPHIDVSFSFLSPLSKNNFFSKGFYVTH